MDRIEPDENTPVFIVQGEDIHKLYREKINEIVDWINAIEKDLARLTGGNNVA